MSKELTVFNFQNHEVRMVVIDDTPYWVAKDVAEVLGYANTNEAVSRHCRGVAKRYPIVDALGRTQEARVIGEPDLYRLIAHSTLPAAVQFEAWIFETVLPAIRKTGRYVNPAAADRWYTAKEVAALWGACLRSAQRHLAIMVAEGRCEMDDAPYRRNRKQPILYRFPDGLPASPHESPTRPVLPSSVDLPKLAKEFKALKAMAVAAGKRGALAVRLADDATRRLRFVSPLELLGIEAPPETDAANIVEALISAADPDQEPNREGNEP